jgi:hypothetical protein
MLSQVEGLLQVDQSTVVGGLDTKAGELYPRGKLEDSRTWFWKLIGAPVPRPVCVISATEAIHQSAQQRTAAVERRDRYGRAHRQGWMTAMAAERAPSPDLISPREAYEGDVAGLPRPVPVAPLEIRRKLDFCSWLLSLVSAQG